MNEQQYALAVLNRLQPPEAARYEHVWEWRSAWFEAWWEWHRRVREAGSSFASAVRVELKAFEQRAQNEREYPGVRESLAYHVANDKLVVNFADLLIAYFDADGDTARRAAARALADWCETTEAVGSEYWRRIFFMPPDDDGEDVSIDRRKYLAVFEADRWVGRDSERHAGAFAVRMRRLADCGSAEPLDSEEAMWLALREVTYADRCKLAYLEACHLRNAYQYLHPILHYRRRVAMWSAADAYRAAIQIGDTSGIEAAECALKVAGAMFGGNVDERGDVIWTHELSDEQRATWERWQAEQASEE